MSAAVEDGIRFNVGWNEGTGLPGPGTFSRLDGTDRRILDAWLACADGRRVDAIVDLSDREWNLGIVPSVFGVFETGLRAASWLLAGYGGAWVLARLSDGSVSDVTNMSGALAMIDADLAGG